MVRGRVSCRGSGIDTLGPIEWEGIRFTGAVSFDGVVFTHPLRMRGVRFESGASFIEAVFQSDATFAEVGFARHASFKRARFEGAADFSGTGFEGLTAFSGTRFDGLARFGDARFEEPAYFENTRFASGAWFRDADFAVEAFFKQASWGGPAAFHGTRFNGETRFQFARFDSEAAFDGARFRRPVSFAKAEFGGPVSFGGVNFTRDALFSEALFRADCRFDDAAFRGSAGFEGAAFTAPVRLNASFSADLVLRGAAAPLVDLRMGASLTDSARVYLQHAAIDRLTADWPQLSGRLAADGDAGFAGLRPVYASLRRDLLARGRGREAREAWIEWMDRLRRSSSWTDSGRIPLELFSLTSRYGTDLLRLGATGGVLILLFAGLYRVFPTSSGHQGGEARRLCACLLLSAAAFARLDLRDVPEAGATRAISAVEALLGWVWWAALVVVSIHLLLS